MSIPNQINVSRLETHPLSTRVYGEPSPSKELLTSLENLGILEPVILNEQEGRYFLLTGNTRVAAWRLLLADGRVKSACVPCVIKQLPNLHAEEVIIQSNWQRVKTTGVKARETFELHRIESTLAHARKGAPKGDQRSQVAFTGKAKDIVAKKTHQSKNTVARTIGIMNAFRSGHPVAVWALARMDTDQLSIAAAYRAICSQGALDVANTGARIAKANRRVSYQLKEIIRVSNHASDVETKELNALATMLETYAQQLREVEGLGLLSMTPQATDVVSTI